MYVSIFMYLNMYIYIDMYILLSTMLSLSFQANTNDERNPHVSYMHNINVDEVLFINAFVDIYK